LPQALSQITKHKQFRHGLLGLFERGEYSVAIVRAGVTVELAANVVVRAELVKKRNLSATFVDSLFKNANGLKGKFDKLIYPVLKGSENYKSFTSLRKDWEKINGERNNVAHSGDFKNKDVATTIVMKARKVLQTMMADYEPTLKFGKTQSEHKKQHKREKNREETKKE